MKKTALSLALSISFGLAMAQTAVDVKAPVSPGADLTTSTSQVNPFTGSTLVLESAGLSVPPSAAEGGNTSVETPVKPGPAGGGKSTGAPATAKLAADGCPPATSQVATTRGTAGTTKASESRQAVAAKDTSKATTSKAGSSSRRAHYAASARQVPRTSAETYLGLQPGARVCPGYSQAFAAELDARRNAKITLLSVIEYSGVRSAILSINGAPVVVREGGITSSGPVHISDSTSVTVGGLSYKVQTYLTPSLAVPVNRQP